MAWPPWSTPAGRPARSRTTALFPPYHSEVDAGPGRARDAPGPAVGARQLALHDTVGALLLPFHDPMKPKVVLAPAARLPL